MHILMIQLIKLPIKSHCHIILYCQFEWWLLSYVTVLVNVVNKIAFKWKSCLNWNNAVGSSRTLRPGWAVRITFVWHEDGSTENLQPRLPRGISWRGFRLPVPVSQRFLTVWGRTATKELSPVSLLDQEVWSGVDCLILLWQVMFFVYFSFTNDVIIISWKKETGSSSSEF